MTLSPFAQGVQAFLEEASSASCAFARGSAMQREWMEGWCGRQQRERTYRARAMARAGFADRFEDSAATPSPGRRMPAEGHAAIRKPKPGAIRMRTKAVR